MSKIKYTNLKPFEPSSSSLEIETREHYYDLHTMADFISSTYNTEDRTAVLVWRYPGQWFLKDKNDHKYTKQYLNKNDINEVVKLIALIFKDVTRYEVQPRDLEMPFTEDNCLSGICTYDDSFNEDALLFEFQSGLKIIIEAEEVYFDRDYTIKY